MAIIYSFPKKASLTGNEIVLISDVDAAGNPSRNATISNIASYTIDVFSDVSAYRIPVASSGTKIVNGLLYQDTAQASGESPIGGSIVYLNSKDDLSGVGSLEVAEAITSGTTMSVGTNLAVVGTATVGGDTTLNGKTTTNGTLSLAGPVNDSTDTTGTTDQLLSSNASGEVTWKNEADLNVNSSQKVIQTVRFGEAVSKGDPVYIDTYNVGQDIQVVGKADASDPNKMPAYGVANADYSTNTNGEITAVGTFNGTFDTSGLIEKAVVYVSPGGGLTSIKPIGTNLIQNIGFCSRSNANNGELEIVAIGRTNDLPNLQEGYIWKGDANGVPQAVSELANSPWEQSGTAIIKQGRDEANYGTPGANAIDGSNSTAASSTKGATGADSTAFGQNTQASGDYSTASGRNSIASAPGTTAFGNFSRASGDYSVSIGSGTTSSGDYSVALGVNTTAGGYGSFTAGNANTASGNEAVALGRNTIASGSQSVAIGDNVEATNTGSIAIGDKDVALKGISSGLHSVMIGKNGLASGNYSIAIGLANNATADYALATGQNSDATGLHAFAHGLNSTASGVRSFSNGWGTTASGANAWAGGKDCIASGDRSFAFGDESEAINLNAIALGAFNEASGLSSVAIGSNTTASGNQSTAMGNSTTASGDNSTASGNDATASGANSWAGGRNTVASGDRSFAFGFGVQADDANMAAFGKYNKLNTGNNSIFQVGIGASDVARDNAFDIHQNGIILMSVLQQSTSYANDGAAQSGGVPIGGLYRNGNVVQIRIT